MSTRTNQIVIVRFADWEWWFHNTRRVYVGHGMDTDMILDFVQPLGEFKHWLVHAEDIWTGKRRDEVLQEGQPETLSDMIDLMELDEYLRFTLVTGRDGTGPHEVWL